MVEGITSIDVCLNDESNCKAKSHALPIANGNHGLSCIFNLSSAVQRTASNSALPLLATLGRI